MQAGSTSPGVGGVAVQVQGGGGGGFYHCVRYRHSVQKRHYATDRTNVIVQYRVKCRESCDYYSPGQTAGQARRPGADEGLAQQLAQKVNRHDSQDTPKPATPLQTDHGAQVAQRYGGGGQVEGQAAVQVRVPQEAHHLGVLALRSYLRSPNKQIRCLNQRRP